MATQFTIYKSTDASAPVLNGTAGSLLTVLDACLVNGYGAKTGAGWTIAYTGTNKRVYRQGGGNSLCYYRVRDTGAGSGSYTEAQIFAAESMSGVDTVVSGRFPLVADSNLTDNALIIRKSSALDSTPRPWVIAADNRTCYLITDSGNSGTSALGLHVLGDTYSHVTNDPYAACVMARPASSGENNANPTVVLGKGKSLYAFSSTSWGLFYQRGYAGTGGACPAHVLGSIATATTPDGGGVIQTGYLPYPNGPDGGLWLERISLIENVTGGQVNLRGWLRGLWRPMHAASNFASGDTLAGTGVLAGRSFLFWRVETSCVVAIETSATVE